MPFLAPAEPTPDSLHATHGAGEHKLMLASGLTGLTVGGIALAPIVTRAVVTPGMPAWNAADFAINACGLSMPSGLAMNVADTIAQVPLIGPTLASGGLATIGTSAGLAILAMWLGNKLDKKSDGRGFLWGKAVRWGLLATSMLVAVPMILSGLSMGLNFLGVYFGVEALSGLASSVGTLGNMGVFTGSAMAKGTAGIMAVHALTCALPMGLSAFFLGHKPAQEASAEMPKLELPPLRQYEGRLMPQRQLQMAAI